MTGAGWRLEWAVARARRRLLAWNVAVPLLLLGPVALSGAPAVHRAVVYAVFVVFFGTFGGCIPLVRQGESGWLEKIVLTGYPERSWILERVAAHASLDVVELAPVLVLILVAEGSGFPEAVLVTASVALALAVANLVGMLVAAAVRSMAEGALVSAAVSLAGLHLAGAFRAPGPGSLWAAAEEISPWRPLVEALRGLSVAAGQGAGAGQRAAIPWPPAEALGEWWLPLLSALMLGAAAWVLAPRILARFTAT